MGMNANKTEIQSPRTLIEAVRFFSDLDTAHNYFAQMRWPNGAVCPHCGSTQVAYMAKYRRYQCSGSHDSRQFTLKTGTVMEDSPIGLDKWAVAFWLEVNAKNSISSYEVHRALGVTQKSAWFMQQRVRLAMQSGSVAKMTGAVEADETFIGGLARNMHKHKRAQKIKGTGGSGKTAVMGLLERHSEKGKSKVRVKVIGTVQGATLKAEVRQHVEAGANLYTDAHAGYTGLAADFAHEFIDHAETYVRGEVHTNGLENFWALFKRCIKGTHVSVEPFHLFRYVDAEAFRFNNRKMNDGSRFTTLIGQIVGKRLTYKQLIGKGGFPTNLLDLDNSGASESRPN